MKKIILFTLIALFVMQCKSEKIKLGKELFPLEQTVVIDSIDEYIEDIKYIIPDTNCFLYSGKILICKNADFITSDRDGNIISVDSEGIFKRIIARYGRGYREFTSVIDLALSKNEDYLFVLDMIEIKVYGLNDTTYYDKIKVPPTVVTDAIAPSDDGNIFLYAAFSAKAGDRSENYLISKIDKSGTIIEQFIKRDDHTFSIDNITQSWGNKYYLRPQNANHIFYEFENTLIPMYQINFGDKNIPYQYNYGQTNNDIGMFMNSPYYKLPIYFYETKEVLYFSAAGPNADKCNYLYFKDKDAGINWNDSKKEAVMPLISSDENYFYFMYNGINSDYYDKTNPANNSPLFRYVSNMFINKWNLTINDDVIVKIKFADRK